MKYNIENVLSAVRRAEYQSSISIQKLIYFNTLARSLVLRAFRKLPKEEESLSLVNHVGCMNCFASNGENLCRLIDLPEEEKKKGFRVVQQSLMETLSLLVQKQAPRITREESSNGQNQALTSEG